MNRRFGCLALFALAHGCTADDADCARLGDKYAELYRAGLDEDSLELDPVVIDNAAEAGRAEVIAQCRRETYSKASVERCLEATTMDEFRKC